MPILRSQMVYHQQRNFCGKANCGSCLAGRGHGPYWYGTYSDEEGKTRRVYIGKSLPAEVSPDQIRPLHQDNGPLSQTKEVDRYAFRFNTLGHWIMSRRENTEWQELRIQDPSVHRLLQFLVSCNHRRAHREQVLDALWPDLDPQMASKVLRKTVSLIRNKIETKVFSLFILTNDVMILGDQTKVWVDADAFSSLLDQATACQNDDGRREQLLQEAVALYQSDYLLDQPDDAWITDRRFLLQQRWISACLDLVDLQLSRQVTSRALILLPLVIRTDPTSEAAVQRLMRILFLQQRRSEAIEIYTSFRVQLQATGIAPSGLIQELYQTILRGRSASESETEAKSDKLNSSRQGEWRRHHGAMIGRNHEQNFLLTLLERTEQEAHEQVSPSHFQTSRSPLSVVLTGEVGIGKTRLAEEIAIAAKRRGWSVAWSRAYSQEHATPLRLWIEILRDAMAQSFWHQLTKRPHLYRPLIHLLPELQEFMEAGDALPFQSPAQEQLRLWEAIKNLLELVGEHAPLLIVLDDLQWADQGSCDLFAYLVRHLSRVPIRMIGTCRDMEIPQDNPLLPLLTDLRREQLIKTLALPPLSHEQVSSIVFQIIQIPEWVIEKITDRAQGNPFFAEELAFFTVRNEITKQDELPETITAALSLRLRRLGSACQQFLSRASVLGGSFTFSTIVAFAQATLQSEDELLNLLEEATRSGMLNETGQGQSVSYQFWHPLLAEHLYSNLSAGRRSKFHRETADMYIRMSIDTHTEAEEAAAITYHLIHGGREASTIARYAVLAGDYAFKAASYVQASTYYELVLKYDKDLHKTWQDQANLLVQLAECTRIKGRIEQALAYLQQALFTRQQHADASIDSQKEAQAQAFLWQLMGHTNLNLGLLTKARACCQEAEELLQTAGVVGGSARAKLKLTLGHICWREGNLPEAVRCAQDAIALLLTAIAPGARWHRSLAEDTIDIGRAYTLMASVESAQGLVLEEALPHHTKALEIYEGYDCKREIAITSLNIGDVYLRVGDFVQAKIAFDRCLVVAEFVGDRSLQSFVFANLGILASRNGDVEHAEREFRKAVLLIEESKDTNYLSWWKEMLARVLIERGKMIEAKEELLQVFKLVRVDRAAPYVGYALMVLGLFRSAEAQRFASGEKAKRFLSRALRLFHLALKFEGLEADAIIETQLSLSQAYLDLREYMLAHKQAWSAYEKSQHFQFRWHLEKCQQQLAAIEKLKNVSFG